MDTKKLATAVRNLKSEIEDLIDDGDITVSDEHGELDECRGLLSVLANIIEGMPVERAFGSPGDWGYGTPIGTALADRS